MVEPFGERLRAWEAEDLSTARLGIQAVCEEGNGTIRLEEERQWAAVRVELFWKASGIFGGLRFDAGERAFRFRFNRSQGFAVKIEKIISKSENGFHWELAHGNASACGQIKFVPVLNEPTGGDELRINFTACFLFGCFRHGGQLFPKMRRPTMLFLAVVTTYGVKSEKGQRIIIEI